MRFRIIKVYHPLSFKDEFCAAIFCHQDDMIAHPIMFGWGSTWAIAVKNCVERNRRVRTSSKIAKTAGEKVSLDNSIHQEQLKAEVDKVRALINQSRGVVLAVKALDLDTEAMRKLEDSRRAATNSLIQLAPRENK